MFEGITAPLSIHHHSPCDGIALWLIADKFDVHINRVGVNLEDNLNNNSASPTLLSGKGLFNKAIIMLGKRQCWARAEVVYVVF